MEIRSGEAKRLPENFSEELNSLALEINLLLDVNEAQLKWTRNQARDLVHAIKNHLAVIKNETDKIQEKKGKVLRAQTYKIINYLDRYTVINGTVRTASNPRSSVAVKNIVDEISEVSKLLYPHRNIRIFQRNLDGLYFHGDPMDLEEILGNLIDNACKCTKRKIVVSGKSRQGKLAIAIDDDGPGRTVQKSTEARPTAR